MSNELTPGSSKRFELYYNDLEWMFFSQSSCGFNISTVLLYGESAA